jgi:hypothetical protein
MLRNVEGGLFGDAGRRMEDKERVKEGEYDRSTLYIRMKIEY